MSRTDELRQSGGRERGGGGSGAPFVKWGDHYVWFEGRVKGTFKTKYGLAATIVVSEVSDHGLIAQGKNEDGEVYTDTVNAGKEVNLGLNSATLDGKITEEDVGKSFHIAFESWEEPKGGNRYRNFTVIELTERASIPEPAAAGASAGDDGLPF